MLFLSDAKDPAVADSTMEPVTLKHFSRKQRRVLGTLLEKAFTTPDQYPLTLKAVVTGCNQKSNRDPVTNYDEDDVQQTLEQLRELGLVGALHTEGGRTERYRHYMRHRTTLNERQLAIITELLLRGRQQPGELRTRASRMVAIDSQEDLRMELQALIDLGIVRANGSLERRGIEVDHNLYAMGENHEPLSTLQDESAAEEPRRATPAPSSAGAAGWQEAIENLRGEVVQLRQQMDEIKDELNDLRRQLGS